MGTVIFFSFSSYLGNVSNEEFYRLLPIVVVDDKFWSKVTEQAGKDPSY